MLIDKVGRKIDYLRLSVTDRCDFRCFYCMSEDMKFFSRHQILSLEELLQLSQAFIDLGVKKIRISGGEPLLRKNIMFLFKNLSLSLAKGDLSELTLTTNGRKLGEYASLLYDLGVKRVNVSVDSLCEKKFAYITKNGVLGKVLESIDKALSVGLRVKVNMVALAGINDDEFNDMILWCGTSGIDLSLIEVMPMGQFLDRPDYYLSLDKVRSRLAEDWTLTISDYKSNGPARYMDIVETGQRIGFITPLSHNFCDSCNRIRVSAEGYLYTCLGHDDGCDLKAIIRGDNESSLRKAINKAIWEKPFRHDFVERRLTRDLPANSRHMSVTGG